MKIVVATPMYPPEIAEPAPYIKEVSAHLGKEHKVAIVAYASTSEKTANATLFTVNKRRPLPFRLLKYTYVLFEASQGADIIYVQGGTASGLPAILVGKLRNIPVVLRFTEDEAWERTTKQGVTNKSLEDFLEKPEVDFFISLIMRLQTFTLRRATVVITTSQYQKETLANRYGFSRERIVTIYNPAPKEEILPFMELVNLHQIIVTTKLTSWSGVNTAIEAVALLVKEFPDIRLVVAGEGPEKARLKAHAEKLSIAKNISFLGYVSRAEAWHLRKTSRVYIESTLGAGSLDRISWSLRAGIPVVVNNVPVLNESIQNGVSGFFVEKADAEELAGVIKKLFTN